MNEHIEKYNKFVNEINNKWDTLNTKLSEVDKKETDILHFIELEKYSAPTGAKILKLLKQVRQERRVIKDEWSDVDCVRKKLNNQIPVKNVDRIYTYRTNVLKMLKEIE